MIRALVLITSFYAISCLGNAFAKEPIQHRVLADGHELVVWEKSGEHSNATILLLHGRTYSSLPDFDLTTDNENLSFMDELVKRGFRVFALDARGYGATSRDKTGWLTPNRAVKDALTVLDWVKSETNQTPHLYGWSYGSMVSQLAAQTSPDSMASITLFGYPFDPQRHVVSSDFSYPATPPAKANTKAHAASDFIAPNAISQEGIDAYVAAALKADPIRVDVKNLHEWGALDASKVTVPTLLIQGELDPIAPTNIQQALFTGLGTHKKWWVVLQGGDHAALLEHSRFEMLDAMQTFIEYVD